MDRLACISLTSLALQVALRRFPDGHPGPLAVVKDDKPTSSILLLNRTARTLGLHSGMRYSQALSIVCDLKAVTVSADDLASAREEILAVLHRWSPRVEVCSFDPSCFWVAAGGLSGLYGTEAQWGALIRTALIERRYRAVVVVGLTRGGTYVLAKVRRRSTVVRTAEAEDRAVAQAPLSIVPLATRQRRLLERLGLTTLAEVLAIPAQALARRFGTKMVEDLRRLESLAKLPIQPAAVPETLILSQRLESPVTDREALLPLIEGPLGQGLVLLKGKARLLAELRLVFVLEDATLLSEVLRPAEPTTHPKTLIRLIALRLAKVVFATGVVELRLAFDDVALPAVSGELFATAPTRDLKKGAEALALIRAQLGNAAVVHPVLVDSNIPDQSFRWVELERLVPPKSVLPPPGLATAVRRIPWKDGPWASGRAGHRMGLSCRLQVVSGDRVVDKEYWFLGTSRQEVVWVSFDKETHQSRDEGMVD